MDSSELKMQGAEAILNILFESLQHGYSIGRCAELFKERTGFVGPAHNRLQLAGLLTINNLMYDEYEHNGGE